MNSVGGIAAADGAGASGDTDTFESEIEGEDSLDGSQAWPATGLIRSG